MTSAAAVASGAAAVAAAATAVAAVTAVVAVSAGNCWRPGARYPFGTRHLRDLLPAPQTDTQHPTDLLDLSEDYSVGLSGGVADANTGFVDARVVGQRSIK